MLTIQNDLMEIRDIILKEGAILIKNAVSLSTLDQIDNDIRPWTEQMNLNATPGYTLSGGEKWIDYMGLCSAACVQLFTQDFLLDLMGAVFGKEAILSELRYHESWKPLSHLSYHSDRAGGIGMFVYLTDMNKENGQFSYIPKTQNNNEFFFIPNHALESHLSKAITLQASRGDVLLFDQDIWHTRAKALVGGRRQIWGLFHPEDRTDAAVDHLLRQSILSTLSPRQLKAVGINRPPFERLANLRRVGQSFKRGDIKNLFLYFLHRPRFSLKKQENSIYNKLVAHRERSRVSIN